MIVLMQSFMREAVVYRMLLAALKLPNRSLRIDPFPLRCNGGKSRH